MRSFSWAMRADAVLVDGCDDVALGDAHAAADGFAIGHLRDVQAGVGGRRRKEQVAAVRGEVVVLRSQSM